MLNEYNNERIEHFKNRNILAVDYGTKVVGLASFCPGRDPFPLTYGRIVVKNTDQIIEDIQKIIKDELFEVIVLGLPLYKDGNESDMTREVKSFSSLLIERTGLELHLQDETLSSFEAEERMKEDPRYNFKVDMKKIDEVAACIILEDFFKKKDKL
tara:strand:- start:39511 stop:39978 length:468 start_codon:yes stop_codon:yes gene_type:complete